MFNIFSDMYWTKYDKIYSETLIYKIIFKKKNKNYMIFVLTEAIKQNACKLARYMNLWVSR